MPEILTRWCLVNHCKINSERSVYTASVMSARGKITENIIQYRNLCLPRSRNQIYFVVILCPSKS